MNIIFDLDGTLIDSSPAILAALEQALEKNQIKPQLPMSHELIGPPLNQLLPRLTGLSDEAKLDRVAADFKAVYDHDSYRSSSVYEGIDELLQDLCRKQCQLFIATNKRQVPTRKIIEYLGWQQMLAAAYSLDSFAGLVSKKELLAEIMHKYRLEPKNTVYVGDTNSDYQAAIANDLHYIMVQWGYGICNAEVPRASSVQQLATLLNQP